MLTHTMSFFSGLILMEADGVTRVTPSRPSVSWQTWIYYSEDLASSVDEENTWAKSSSSTSELTAEIRYPNKTLCHLLPLSNVCMTLWSNFQEKLGRRQMAKIWACQEWTDFQSPLELNLLGSLPKWNCRLPLTIALSWSNVCLYDVMK